jgi:hypothetical protein
LRDQSQPRQTSPPQSSDQLQVVAVVAGPADMTKVLARQAKESTISASRPRAAILRTFIGKGHAHGCCLHQCA